MPPSEPSTMPIDCPALLHTLFEGSAEALIALDAERRIRHWNPAAQQLFGYAAAEMLGQPLLALSPADRRRESQQLLTLPETEAARPHRALLAGKNGRMVSVSLRTRPLPGHDGQAPGLLLFLRECSTSLDLQQSQQLQALVANSDDGIITKDLNGIITSWNPGAERLFGWLAEEIIGRPMRTLIPADRQHEEDHILKRLVAGEKVDHFETERLRKDGSTVFVSVTVSPLRDAQGLVVGASKIARDIGVRLQAERVIHHHATVDPITGLLNRRAFSKRLRELLQQADAAGRRMALLMIDLDRFKAVNDTLGHQVGDLLLRQVGRRLRQVLREGDVIARQGGDEFTALLPQVEHPAEAMAVAQRISQALTEPFLIEGKRPSIGGSVGVAVFPEDGRSAELLMQHADEAMYGSKRAGGSRAARLSAEEQAAAKDRARLLADLHPAIAQGQLRLVYQPVRRFSDGSVLRSEALVRWAHPERGLLGPGLFIPLAEEAGLLNALGDWVFREAARQLADWRRRLHPQLQVSINLSPSQLRAGADYFRGWSQHLRELALPPSALILEITEGMVVDQSRDTAQLLRRIREQGAQIAIDDFGTGYSSLSQLSRLDVQYLKVDQSFVRQMMRSERERALVEAIVSMAQKLGLQAVAEGVETAEQAQLLQLMGCDYGQGYLYARPLPPDEVEQHFPAA